MRIVFAGTPEFAVPSLSALLRGEVRPVPGERVTEGLPKRRLREEEAGEAGCERPGLQEVPIGLVGLQQLLVGLLRGVDRADLRLATTGTPARGLRNFAVQPDSQAAQS